MGYLGGFKFLRFFMYIYFPTQILIFFLLRNKKYRKVYSYIEVKLPVVQLQRKKRFEERASLHTPVSNFLLPSNVCRIGSRSTEFSSQTTLVETTGWGQHPERCCKSLLYGQLSGTQKDQSSH